jgi:hypothetical protein
MSMVPFSTWTPRKPPWVHTPDDGRGKRTVFLDGVELRQVIHADELAGVVEYCEMPIRIAGGHVVTTRRTGNVVVKFE